MPNLTSIGTHIPIEEIKGGTNQTSYTKGDLIYSSATDTLSKLPIEAIKGTNLITDGTDIVWGDRNKYFSLFDDFVTNPPTSAESKGVFGLQAIAAAGGGLGTNTGSYKNPGVWTCKTGTGSGSNSVGGYNHYNGSSIFGATYAAVDLEFYHKMSTLSDATNTYVIMFGFMNGNWTSKNEPSTGIYFYYTHGVNSGQWVGKTSFGSTRTSANSTIAGEFSSYHKFRISLNAAATSVSFYIDDVEISGSPITTNITQYALGSVSSKIAKTTAGTANRVMYMDYVKLDYYLTTTR